MIEAYQNMVVNLLDLAYRDVCYAKKLVDESKTGRCPAAIELIQDVTKFIYETNWLDTLCRFIEVHPEVYLKRIEAALDEFWSAIEGKSA